MKRKIIALLTAVFVLGGQAINTYAEDSQPKEIQLTDYRYTSATRGLYGYNFFNGNFCMENYWFFDGDSVILKPDGTELFQQGKYFIQAEYNGTGEEFVAKGESFIYRLAFPQYEKRFLVQKKVAERQYNTYILDGEGNEIRSWDRSFADGMFWNENICIFKHLGDTYPKFWSINGGVGFANIETGNFVYSIDNKKFVHEVLISTSKEYLSTDEAFIDISKDGKYFKIEHIGHEPFYYNVSGAEENPPEGTEFEPLHTDSEYYGIVPGKGITTDKMDKSYVFKEKNIGGKTHYALFKTLSDDESAEDYKPKEQPSVWAVDTIGKATAEGLLYNNANCRYKANISRQDFAVLAVEAYCKSQGMEVDEFINKNNIALNSKKFSDTDNVYILLADYLGIAKGTSENTFSPDKGITRQEAAVMLNNIAKLAGVKANAGRIDYTDKAKFSKWADDAIYNVSSIRTKDGVPVMSGMAEGIFSPWSLYSREQAYVSIYRLYEVCSENSNK